MGVCVCVCVSELPQFKGSSTATHMLKLMHTSKHTHKLMQRLTFRLSLRGKLNQFKSGNKFNQTGFYLFVFGKIMD